MTYVAKRRTLSEEAYDAIRDQIRRGLLAPGTRLVVGALARDLQLSATPVNEALSALDREGLVTYSPHRGYSVRRVTVENVEEIYTVREVIESLAVRLTAERDDPAVTDRLRALLEQARRAVRLKDSAAFSDLDIAFHRTIWEASGNSLVARIAELIEGQVRLLVATAVRVPGRFRGALEEHDRIYDAVRAGSGRKAELAMRRHIRNAKQALETSAARRPQLAGHVGPAGAGGAAGAARRK